MCSLPFNTSKCSTATEYLSYPGCCDAQNAKHKHQCDENRNAEERVQNASICGVPKVCVSHCSVGKKNETRTAPPGRSKSPRSSDRRDQKFGAHNHFRLTHDDPPRHRPFLIRANTDVVENQPGKSGNKPAAASGFNAPFHRLTEVSISDLSADRDTAPADRRDAARTNVRTTDPFRVVDASMFVTTPFSFATRCSASSSISFLVPKG